MSEAEGTGDRFAIGAAHACHKDDDQQCEATPRQDSLRPSDDNHLYPRGVWSVRECGINRST
jgi:hypothetical protein